jgi:phosphoribosyl 1,2-cyclic phosphodiesterase
LFADLFTAGVEEEPPRRAAAPRPRVAGLSLCVLGSGSGGNSAAVRFGDDLILIDLGFGPRTIARRLDQARSSLSAVRAICLTHLDQDHFRPRWVPTLIGWGIKVFLHRWHAQGWSAIPGGDAMRDAGLVEIFDETGFEPLPGLRVSPVHLAHDVKGTSGFHLASRPGSLGYATDLGHVPDELLERFTGVDLLAIESNYDPPMQLKSARPLFLKRRIMGHAGHLSNQQCFEAVCELVRRCPRGVTPRHVVLLHRSRQCNDPEVVREVFARDPSVFSRVVLSEQRRRTRWFTAKPAPAGAAVKQLHFGF